LNKNFVRISKKNLTVFIVAVPCEKNNSANVIFSREKTPANQNVSQETGFKMKSAHFKTLRKNPRK
jgi:hypothetical protein